MHKPSWNINSSRVGGGGGKHSPLTIPPSTAVYPCHAAHITQMEGEQNSIQGGEGIPKTADRWHAPAHVNPPQASSILRQALHFGW